MRASLAHKIDDEVFWLWTGNAGLSPYDDIAQEHIEKNVQSLIAKKMSGENSFILDKGPFFGLPENKGCFELDITLAFDGDRPIIVRSRQRTVKNEFVRNCMRIPPLLSADDMEVYFVSCLYVVLCVHP